MESHSFVPLQLALFSTQLSIEDRATSSSHLTIFCRNPLPAPAPSTLSPSSSITPPFLFLSPSMTTAHSPLEPNEHAETAGDKREVVWTGQNRLQSMMLVESPLLKAAASGTMGTSPYFLRSFVGCRERHGSARVGSKLTFSSVFFFHPSALPNLPPFPSPIRYAGFGVGASLALLTRDQHPGAWWRQGREVGGVLALYSGVKGVAEEVSSSLLILLPKTSMAPRP
jgi:hypothetical protein